ncbi:MAG: SDR family oxidoreductase [Lentisphaeria bacterium]|nr:SDR family oxidoreductase [Lentisphaeria bacterium]
MYDFHGKTAVVTGGSCGIGKAVAADLAKCGAKVWYCSRNSGKTIDNSNAVYRKCDISNSAEIKEWFAEIAAADGKIDFLVNNVGCDKRVTFDEADEEEFDKFILLNLKSAFSVSRAALELIRKGEGKSIVNIGTTNWMLGLAPFTLYGAAKSGLIGFTRSLARELGREMIRANMVSPGWIMTERQLADFVTEQDKADLLRDQALPFLLDESSVVPAVLFLLSEQAKGITGQNIIVDGGKLMI